MRIRRSLALMSITLVALLVALAGCDVSIWFGDLPDSDPDPEPEPLEAGIYFSLEWSNNSVDRPHLYITYPAPADGDTTDDFTAELGGPPQMLDPYDIYYVYNSSADVGFFPEDIDIGPPNESSDFRGTVYYQDPESAYPSSLNPALELLESGESSELAILREFPFFSSADVYTTVADGSANDYTGLPVGDYAWVGVMEVYAYATSGQLAYEGSSDDVGAVLYIFEADGFGNETILASYEVPSNTDVKGTSLVRINCLYEQISGTLSEEVYQFVPDVRVLQDSGQIRSVAPAGASDAEIVTVRRPAR